MGCNCGKKKIGTQTRRIVKQPKNKTINANNKTLKRIIRRSAY